MGAVYKAQHKLMDRVVALKVIRGSLIGKEGVVERFVRELKAAARLRHPNIVTAYDAEQVGDTHLLVMELVEGISLDRIISNDGPLPVDKAIDYIRQAALGLQHAHERGMVHRDIKPQNLMLTPEGQIKILDFGLARIIQETASAETPALAGCPSLKGEGAPPITQDGEVMGTPDYIAPEQVSDPRTADARVDLYSLGCTLYHLLAGHTPFHDETVLHKLSSHQERHPQAHPRLAPICHRN
jgi:serine/threonine protein kinase